MSEQKGVYLTPKEPFYFEGREVIHIYCKMNAADVRARERKLAVNRATKRPIKCLNNNQVYPSVNQASKALKLCSSSISKVLKGTQQSTKGFRFTYQ